MEPSSRHGTQTEAIEEATHRALESRPSQVVMHAGRGEVAHSVVYDTAESADGQRRTEGGLHEPAGPRS